MRHLRLFTALLAVAAITAACSSTPNAGSGGQSQGSQPSTGSQPSQAAASTGSGGGGGGGANGSITYEITGGYEASGELPFQPLSSIFDSSTGGWSASFADATGGGSIMTLNTAEAGQIINFGDGTAVVIGVSDAGSGQGCTFTMTKNDASGLSGHVECTNADVAQESGIGKAKLTADWDAHP